MAFFSTHNGIFKRLRRSERLGKEQLQQLVHELARDLKQGETLLQSLPIGIILLDKKFHIQLMNRAAQRCPLFFMNHFNGKGAIWYDLGNEELAHWLEHELQGEGVPQPREFIYFTEENLLKVIRIEISSQVHDGSIEGWIILVLDVSELRQQERKVQQLDILASLSTVTAGVAHEIKNPLAAMSLHVELMQRLLRNNTKKADEQVPNEQVPNEQILNEQILNEQILSEQFPREQFQGQMLEYCQVVQEEIERLNTFVTDFLLTVRPLELELVSQSPNKPLLTCIELLQPELETKQIALELNLAKDLPNVALDPSMFKHLLLNLLQNAIQAIEEKAEHMTFHAQIHIRSYNKNDKVYLEFTDNGCGMNKETKKKILEPFFTTRAKGTGLGMTMVLRILQTHNGDLQIQSELGTGTLLRIELPIFQRKQKLLVQRTFL